MENYLVHHGILGMKWGVRRYQNPDGSLTTLGKKRYSNGMSYKELEKSLKTDRNKFWNDYKYDFNSKERKDEDRLLKKREKLNDEAWELYEKYNFDGDDGGGGRTKKDQKAVAKYLKLQEQINDIDEASSNKTNEYVERRIVEKYGKELLDDFKKDQKQNYEEGEKYYNRWLKASLGFIGVAGATALGYGLYKEFGGGKGRTFSTQELRNMGIDVFEPDRIKLH